MAIPIKMMEEKGTLGTRQKAWLDFEELFWGWFDGLPAEEKKGFLMSVSLYDSICESVVLRLANNDYDFWSSTDDKNMLLILATMEDSLISQLKWKLLQRWDIDKFIKSKRVEQHIYWKMYHDKEHHDFFYKWLMDNGIESEHSTKIADEEIEELKNKINSILESLKPKAEELKGVI